MDEAGVLDALQDANHLIFLELRRSAIPDEDILILRRAGFEDPEGEVLLVITKVNHFHHYDRPISEIPVEARQQLKNATEQLLEFGTPKTRENASAPRKRKLFNGIGKILAGSITAAGDLLLLGGSIIAPNPATGYGVIASSALAIASIGQGIGDLKGE